MAATIVAQEGSSVTLQVRIDLGSQMLENEEKILEGVNEVGALATRVALERFDTNGDPIRVGVVKMTSKGKDHRVYQSPFGPVSVDRHVYQSSRGGPIYCPLEKGARIIIKSTPKFAKMVSSKYSQKDARWVVRDLESNHGRRVAVCLVQKLSEMVGAITQAADEAWAYETPEPKVPVRSIGIGIDGTCMLMVDEGWRQAMVGTIALFDRHGERLHTTYIGAPPELGRETFLRRMEREIAHVKTLFPRALPIGLADGAPSNWEFLEKHTDLQVLDFYHVSEHLTQAADILFAKNKEAREDWLEKVCHRLKHDFTGPRSVAKEMVHLARVTKLSAEDRMGVLGEVQYFRNNFHRMPYALEVLTHRPIGSGVTEAACKVIIKQRLGCSGMKWKEEGAGAVVSLRCLNQTSGRWEQFWAKSQALGYPDGLSGTLS